MIRYQLLGLMPRRFRRHFPRWYWTQAQLSEVEDRAKAVSAWLRSEDTPSHKDDD